MSITGFTLRRQMPEEKPNETKKSTKAKVEKENKVERVMTLNDEKDKE